MTTTARRRSIRSLLAALAMLAATVVLVTGCGSDDGSGSSDSTSSDTTSADTTNNESSSSDEASGDAIEVGVETGQMKFDTDELTAKAGSVTFEFTNPDDVPHDFVIEKDGTKIGGTDLITNDSATLTVDLEPGEYEFYCTPHRSIGMTGTLTVS